MLPAEFGRFFFPKEFTKLDEIVEALFFTAEDSKQESDEDAILGQDASTESPDIRKKTGQFSQRLRRESGIRPESQTRDFCDFGSSLRSSVKRRFLDS